MASYVCMYACMFLPEICGEEIAEEIFLYFALMYGLGLEPWLYVY